MDFAAGEMGRDKSEKRDIPHPKNTKHEDTQEINLFLFFSLDL